MADPSAPFFATPASTLVGRDRELATLRGALATALAGHGSVTLIGGEAGIGKTALAEALLAQAADQGATVLVGHCYDLAETPPYGPWAEALARAPRDGGVTPAPDLAGGAGTTQAALYGQVRRFLTALATARPLVLLLEDLHWADPASLDLLRTFARQLADLPLLLLATYRVGELTHDPLDALLPTLVREARATRLDLRPLDEAAIGALIALRYALDRSDHDRLVTYLVGRTDGNTLFLRELLRTLEGAGLLRPGTRSASGAPAGAGGAPADGSERWAAGDLESAPVPALLRQVIAGRVARLPVETGRLLAVAAVVGQEVPLALWATLGDVPEEDLLGHAERALAAQLVTATPDGAGVRFAHALIREALYEATPVLRRRGWHRRVAEALLAIATPDPDAVANHLQRAGDPRAFAWLVRAGLRAHLAAAWLTAAERFATAAALPDADGTHAPARGWLLYCRAQLLAFSDPAQSLRALDGAEAHALAAGDRALATLVRFVRGRVRCMGGDIRRGLAEMERQVADLDALPGEYHLRSSVEVGLALLRDGERASPPPARAPAGPTIVRDRAVLANWLAYTGRYREALDAGDIFLAASAGGDRREQISSVQIGLGHAHAALGRPDAALRALARSREASEVRDNTHIVGLRLWFELLLVAIPYRADDVAERARLVAEAAQAWERARGTITDTPPDDPADLLPALVEGRWAAAQHLAHITSTNAAVNYAQGAVVALGVLARHQGAPAAAWVRVRDVLPAGPDTEPGDALFWHAIALQALAADLALDAGDPATAGDWVGAHGRWLAYSGAVLWQADHQRLRARLALVSGDPAARAHAEAALAHATEPRQPLAQLAAHRLLGEMDTTAGRHAEAADHLAEALALANACAAPYERALTLLALVELHRATGRVAEARGALVEARATCDRLGAVPALARADRLAARLALVRPAAYPDDLTGREVDVLRLVAAGQSNREAAAALAVSGRTVERHLESVYRKIAARNRAEATAYAIRHNLT